MSQTARPRPRLRGNEELLENQAIRGRRMESSVAQILRTDHPSPPCPGCASLGGTLRRRQECHRGHLSIARCPEGDWASVAADGRAAAPSQEAEHLTDNWRTR